MRRLLAAFGAAVVTAALFPVVSVGSPTPPFQFGLDYGSAGHHTAQPVDRLTWCNDCGLTDYTTGTPWVVNPRTSWPYSPAPSTAIYEPGCMWDSDDFYVYTSAGDTIAAGASVTVRECIYGLSNGHANYIRLTSASPDLLITETVEWAGGSASATVTPVDTGNGWLYLGCFMSPPAYSGYVEIPDSHGGSALPQLVTFTVANPTPRKIGRTGGRIDADLRGFVDRSGCSPNSQDWTHL